MDAQQPFIDENKALWDAWTDVHVVGEFYDRDRFVRDPDDIRVNPEEIAEVGDVTGKSLLHLQCHFGLDTLSWARLGATVTGADLSPRGIDEARRLAADAGIDATFVEANLYDLPEVLPGTFDVVYTGIGAIYWLPDIRRWAEVVAHYLAPGGTFFILEGHPTFFVFENEGETEPKVTYPYFHRDEPLTFDVKGSYADPEADVSAEREHGWVHSLGDVVTALIDAGLEIRNLREYPFLLWDASFLEQRDDGRWYLPASQPGEIPLMFSITATKPVA